MRSAPRLPSSTAGGRFWGARRYELNVDRSNCALFVAPEKFGVQAGKFLSLRAGYHNARSPTRIADYAALQVPAESNRAI